MDWYDPTLTVKQQTIAKIRLDYGSRHGPSWLKMAQPPRPRFAIGQMVLAVLPPFTAEDTPAIIVGTVNRIARDKTVSLKIVTCRGDVAGHLDDNRAPYDKITVNASEIYQVVGDFDGEKL